MSPNSVEILNADLKQRKFFFFFNFLLCRKSEIVSSERGISQSEASRM